MQYLLPKERLEQSGDLKRMRRSREKGGTTELKITRGET